MMSTWGATLYEVSPGTELCPLGCWPWLPRCALGRWSTPATPFPYAVPRRALHSLSLLQAGAQGAEICTSWSSVSSPGCSGSLGMPLTIMDSEQALMHTHPIPFPYTDFQYICAIYSLQFLSAALSPLLPTSQYLRAGVWSLSPRWKSYLPFWAALLQGTQSQFIPISRLKTSSQRRWC